jgi:Tol biopolymer transport system component
MPINPGTRLGAYEVISTLGAGGMGEVYRARDVQLDRDVALKVLPDAFADDVERLRRFEREAKSLAALNHPNIAQVYGLAAGDGRRAPAIAMEFVDGQSLDAVKGPWPADELVPVLQQIAAALEAAHDSGIVHRDLKPANIKIRNDGTVKVLDFGLAKAFDPTAASSDPSASPTITSPATGLGVILGTAAYMSPEQARGRPVDRRADIWAFGVIAFELLTGARLFEGETISDTVAAVLRQEIPWHRLPASTPRQLQRLLRRCLVRDVKERLKDAGDIRLEIDDLRHPSAADERPPVAARQRRRPLVIALMVFERLVWIALIAGGTGLGWSLGRSGGEADDESWSQFTQLTEEAGREVAPSISPDGDSIAYATHADGGSDIYVRRVGGRTTTRLAADPARSEGAPAFSPDGRSVAFHEADTDGGIFVVGATGESERRVTDAGFHPAWSPDGNEIVFCQERIVIPASRVVVSALSVVNLASGAIRVITKGDAVQPSWSPSGNRIAYWANRNGQRDIFTIARDGGEPVQITDDAAMDWAVAWGPDGRSLYFSSDRGGSMNIWRIAVDEASGRAEGRPEPVTSGVQAALASPALSRDGKRLVFVSSVSSINPVAIPLSTRGEGTEAPRFLLQQTGTFVPTSISPDGTMLAIAAPGRTDSIWVSGVDGSGLRLITDDAFRNRVPMWSADGTELLFYSNRSGKYEVWTIRKDGSGLRQISSRPNDSMNWAFYDPAGRRIWAYANTPGNVSYTFPIGARTPQAGEAMPQIKVEGGLLRPHAITRNGEWLAGLAMSTAGARIGIGWHNLKSGETWISRESAEIGLPAWIDDQRFVFGADNQLVVIDTAKRRRVIGGPFPFDVTLLTMPAVSPDGRTVFVGGGRNESDIWMVQRVAR